MKKLLIAATASLLLFGGHANVSASAIDVSSTQAVETQEMSDWTDFRDKVLGRDRENRYSDNSRRDKRDSDRRRDSRDDYRDDYRNRDRTPSPPPRYGNGSSQRYTPAPPPPPQR